VFEIYSGIARFSVR